MAKSTKKQQRHAQKKRKQRAEKRRRLRRETRTEHEAAPPLMGAAEQQLRSSIQKFAFQKSFSADLKTAVNLYFEEDLLRTGMLDLDDPKFADFQEWYIFDFVTAGGDRLIDLFAEAKGPSLPRDQRQMLDDWIRTNRLRLLEIQEVTPGVGEVVKDLLSGEIFHCNDISMSRHVRKWSIVTARLILTQGRLRFTGGGNVFAPMDKDELLSIARGLWQGYQTQNPSASLDDFYRNNSLQLRKLTTGQRFRGDPVYVTAEYHPLIKAIAEYEVLNPPEVWARLDDAEEFVFAGESEEVPGAGHYNWLLRGRSRVPENQNRPAKALQLRTEWTTGPGQPAYRSLGDVTVTDATLELSCMSRERLAAGRSLLEALLPDAILHRDDRFSDFDLELDTAADTAVAARPAETDPAMRQIEIEMLARQAEQWLDTPLTGLDDQTPREASQSAEGRAKLEDALKIIEYLEEENPALQGTPYSAQALRRELGLT